MSKLAPALAQMVASHRAIRSRAFPPNAPRRSLLQLSRPDVAAFQEAETLSLSGRSLKAVAKEVGIGHERLSRLLRERGLRLRNQCPTREGTAQMKTRYSEGMSLERIGTVLGYSPGTVRVHLLAGPGRHARLARTLGQRSQADLSSSDLPSISSNSAS